MDSSEEMEGWNLLRKWSMAPSTTVWLSFVGIGDAISFEAMGTISLSPDEKRLDFLAKGCTAVVDLTDIAFEQVVSDELLSSIERLGVLPESLKLSLRTGDLCTLAVRSERPS